MCPSSISPPRLLTQTLAMTIDVRETVRADVALLAELKHRWPALSRATLRGWFDAGRIQIDGNPGERARKLAPGRYEIMIPDFDESRALPGSAHPSPHGCFLEVLHEGPGILALNKTSGIPSVPHAPDETDTAVSAALAHDPSLAAIGRGGYEPAILHRLDTGTSGVLLFARTADEFARLRAGWNTGLVRKRYRALVRGESEPLSPLPMEITIPLAHDPKSSRRMVACTGSASRLRDQLPAETQVLSSHKIREGYLDLTIEIRTGVMHQIRCHLAHLGWPVLGDPVYRGVPSSRLWLHAWQVELTGADGNVLSLEAPLPAGWPMPAKS